MIYNMTSQAKFTVTDWMGPNINIITAHTIISTSLLHRKCLPTPHKEDAGCAASSDLLFQFCSSMISWRQKNMTDNKSHEVSGYSPGLANEGVPRGRQAVGTETETWHLTSNIQGQAKKNSSSSVCVCVCVCVWGGGFLTAAANNWRENLRMDAS